jgi:hypothetical protein
VYLLQTALSTQKHIYIPHTLFTSIWITYITNFPKRSEPYLRWRTPILLLIFITAIFQLR